MKIKWLITGAVFFLVFSLSWSKSIDLNQDLGRHLKLGEIIVKTKSVPGTNLFSYTNPSFPFVNHHWLTEVAYYTLTSAFGPIALVILRFALLAGAVYLALKGRFKQSHFLAVVFSIILFIPLLFDRIGIRPELFGYLFFSLLLYLMLYQKSTRLQYLIPPVMLLWANLHISFVFGMFLVVIGGLKAWRGKRPVYGYLLGMAAVILNPNGITGALEPFIIFRNYGYSIVENQNIFFLNAVTINPILRYYLYLLPLTIFAFVILVAKRQYAGSLILAVFYLLGMWQIRHIPFFAFAAMFYVSETFVYAAQDMRDLQLYQKLKKIPFDWVLLISLGVLIVLVSTSTLNRIFDNPRTFGYGFYEEQKEGTDFILRNRLPGRLFNNFDIGGYAIYRLYPRYQVFVDNRPEAYPSDFFQKVYIPLQENDDLRKEVFRQYNIHTVLFAHTDITPWAKKFDANILSDPSWKLVFMNSSVFVMSDRTSLPDIRNNPGFLSGLIENTSDPNALLHYLSFFSMLNQDSLVNRIMIKLKEVDPLSCSVKRIEYEMRASSDSYFGGGAEGKPWWCY